MSRSRISEGFHRVGLVLAIPFVIFGFAAALVNRDEKLALSLLVIGLGLYATARAIGWITEGFRAAPENPPPPPSAPTEPHREIGQ